MTDIILGLFRRKRKPDAMSTAQRRIYEAAVRQVLARRYLYGAHVTADAPWNRSENATRRVSLPRRAA